MKMKLTVAAALLLVPTLAMAQAPTPTPAPAQAPAPAQEPAPRMTVGYLDFGARATTTSGDAARYERYRDLSDGLFLEVARLGAQKNGWSFAFAGDHVGRKDQRLVGSADRQGKFGAYFMWDEIPMLMSRTTRTFYQGDVLNNGGVLQMSDAIQQAGQTNANNIPLLFTPENTQQFELRTDRHIAETGLRYLPNEAFTINGLFRNTQRTGGIPYGGSFGHSQLVETIAPIDHQTRDFDANVEYAHDRYLFRGGYTGSWFTNANTSLAFDNPWRAVDSTSVSSRGRISLPFSNSFVTVNGMASVKLPAHSRVTAYFSGGMLQDAGDAILPQTINTALTGINPLPRATIEGEAKTMSANLTFTSRPKTWLDFNARYKTYDYDNRTPIFTSAQRISYDNSVSAASPPMSTEPFGVTRRSFDVEARYLPMAGTSIGFGYNNLSEERTHRIYEDTSDNTVRVTFDTIGNSWFSLRSRYEHSQKRGNGLDEEVLTEVGEQADLRHMDLAPRDRNRVTVIAILSPVNNLSFNVSAAAGKDDYKESIFGIRDNNHRVYAAGVDWTPRDNMAFGASYSHENYMALARSRQANPATPTGCVPAYPPPAGKVTCQFDDPARNWAVDTDDGVHSFILNADFTNLWKRVDIRLAYDWNDSTSTYHYITGSVPDRTLPEETPDIPSTLPDPVQLPDVLSTMHRGTFDLVYNFNKRVGLGLSYWYENYDVQDFALDAEAIGNQARSNAVLLGYLYTPYTAQTGWVRLIVRW
jgi:MtrB/PioB family decaheme-associated outer membrane protein